MIYISQDANCSSVFSPSAHLPTWTARLSSTPSASRPERQHRHLVLDLVTVHHDSLPLARRPAYLPLLLRPDPNGNIVTSSPSIMIAYPWQNGPMARKCKYVYDKDRHRRRFAIDAMLFQRTPCCLHAVPEHTKGAWRRIGMEYRMPVPCRRPSVWRGTCHQEADHRRAFPSPPSLPCPPPPMAT